jgi:hypothetical protein
MSVWQNLGDGLWHGQASARQAPSYRYMWRESGFGRGRDTRCLSLGPDYILTLADAVRLARYAASLVHRGIDPISVRQAALINTKLHWDEQ